MAANEKEETPGPSMAFLNKRPLFNEDLTPAEDKRSNKKRSDHIRTLPRRAQDYQEAAQETAADSTKPEKVRKEAQSTADSYAAIRPHLKSVNESRESTAKRIGNRLMRPNSETRMKGETAAPGASWYADHNQHIHEAIKGTDIPFEHAAVSSGSMSPLNGPDDEVSALKAIAHATHTNAKTTITPQIAAHVRAKVAADTKIKDKPEDVLPDHQVGREVGFNELHPGAITHLTTKPSQKDKTDPLHGLHTDIDLDGIRRAGPNRSAGVRGIRGESNNALNPPAGAPKVNTYVHNGLSFDSKNPAIKDEIDFRTTDTVRRARREDLDAKRHTVGLTPAEDEQHKYLPSSHDVPLDFHNTHDDRFHMTPSVAAHIESRGGVVHTDQVGTKVRMRDVHPATAMALSHPSNPDPHTRTLAVLSSQHPTVQDSWAQAEMHNQPNVNIGRSTNVRKAGGSEALGYWKGKEVGGAPEWDRRAARNESKRLKETGDSSGAAEVMSKLPKGTPVVNRKRPEAGKVTSVGLGHAEYDKITRMAAQHVQKHLNLPYDYPSTAAQAMPWVEMRREAPGKDAEFEAHKKDQKAPAPSIHAQGNTGRSQQFLSSAESLRSTAHPRLF